MKHKASDLPHCDVWKVLKSAKEMENAKIKKVDDKKEKAKARKKKIKYFKATVRVLVNRLRFWRGK